MSTASSGFFQETLITASENRFGLRSFAQVLDPKLECLGINNGYHYHSFNMAYTGLHMDYLAFRHTRVDGRATWFLFQVLYFISYFLAFLQIPLALVDAPIRLISMLIQWGCYKLHTGNLCKILLFTAVLIEEVLSILLSLTQLPVNAVLAVYELRGSKDFVSLLSLILFVYSSFTISYDKSRLEFWAALLALYVQSPIYCTHVRNCLITVNLKWIMNSPCIYSYLFNPEDIRVDGGDNLCLVMVEGENAYYPHIQLSPVDGLVVSNLFKPCWMKMLNGEQVKANWYDHMLFNKLAMHNTAENYHDSQETVYNWVCPYFRGEIHTKSTPREEEIIKNNLLCLTLEDLQSQLQCTRGRAMRLLYSYLTSVNWDYGEPDPFNASLSVYNGSLWVNNLFGVLQKESGETNKLILSNLASAGLTHILAVGKDFYRKGKCPHNMQYMAKAYDEAVFYLNMPELKVHTPEKALELYEERGTLLDCYHKIEEELEACKVEQAKITPGRISKERKERDRITLDAFFSRLKSDKRVQVKKMKKVITGEEIEDTKKRFIENPPPIKKKKAFIEYVDNLSTIPDYEFFRYKTFYTVEEYDRIKLGPKEEPAEGFRFGESEEVIPHIEGTPEHHSYLYREPRAYNLFSEIPITEIEEESSRQLEARIKKLEKRRHKLKERSAACLNKIVPIEAKLAPYLIELGQFLHATTFNEILGLAANREVSRAKNKKFIIRSVVNINERLSLIRS